MFLVEILKTSKRLKVKAGELYVAKRYHMDPMEKMTLLYRLPDGYDPSCNQYMSEIKILGTFNPWKEENPYDGKNKKEKFKTYVGKKSPKATFAEKQ